MSSSEPISLLRLLALALPLLIWLPVDEISAAEVEDSCVDCHSKAEFLVTNKKLHDYFQEWRLSIHRQEEVSCFDCHGGDPENPQKDGAHEGELSASKKRSAVNFENIPATCGQCHDDIYEGFLQSAHYEHLIKKKQEGQGPNCVTCHGSLNVAALNVNTVEAACSRCHNEKSDNHPEIPDEARLLLNKFLSIHRFYRFISIRGDPVRNREFFEKIDVQLHDLSVDWHTFDLEKIGKRTLEVLGVLKGRRSEVRERNPR